MDRVFLYLTDVMEKIRSNTLARTSRKQMERILSLTIRQEKALIAVSNMSLRTPDGITLKALAKRLNMTLPATSILVESMVRNGLFVRDTSPADRRAVCIRLSPNGMKELNKLCNYVSTTVDHLFDGVSKEDKAAFERVVKTFYGKLYSDEEE